MSLMALLIALCIFLQACTTGEAIQIHDSSIYKNNEYINLEEYQNTWLINAGNNASKFFPEYEDINFEYSSVDFYIYCNTVNDTFITFPDATLILELSFSDKESYDSAKENINNTYEYLKEPVKSTFSYEMPSGNFMIGSYDCFVIKNDKDRYLKSFNTICYNEDELKIRYLYCYETDTDSISSINQLVESIKQRTACDW